MEASELIDALCKESGIPSVVADLAKYFFKEAYGGGIYRHSCGNNNGMVAACIFIACRQSETSRSFQEIAKLTNISKAEVGRNFKMLDMFFANQAYFRLEGEEENNSAETDYG